MGAKRLPGETHLPIKFGVVIDRQRFVLKLAKNYKFDLTKSKLHEILGFKPRVYEDVTQEAKHVANISLGMDNIYIHYRERSVSQQSLLRGPIILHTFQPPPPPNSQ